jgi:membrane protein required for colicin V production
VATIDLVLLGLVLFFAIVGGFTGAARQVANLVGLAVGWFVSRRLGPLVGPKLAASMDVSLLLGTLVGTGLVFLFLWVAVRYILAVLFRRILAGRDPENRGLDRTLGFILGGAKVGVVLYAFISALTFFDKHVVVAGRQLNLSPRDSLSFQLARQYNLFEMTQFAPLKDLIRVAQIAGDPQRVGQLQDDPAFKALKKDPRFQRALRDDSLRRALERGDHQALLRSNLVLQLIQDPDFAARLGAASRAAEE